MYLSHLSMKNWRAYSDAEFNFARPTRSRPVTLIGAMNGHGKTSFLMALYLGLFGKHGLVHCEGFRRKTAESDKSLETIRNALNSFRRIGAPPQEPTEISLTFSPARPGEDYRELRITRRWHFTAANKAKPGSDFEELEIHVSDNRSPDGRFLNLESDEDAIAQIERRVFPAHLTPAFFFDGEQAAEMIEHMGDGGLRKAVEVMFGTKLLNEVGDRLRLYMTSVASKVGGKGKAADLHTEQLNLQSTVDELNRNTAHLQKQRKEIEAEKQNREDERQDISAKLRDHGTAAISEETAQKDVQNAEGEYRASQDELAGIFGSAGVALATARFKDRITDRLDREAIREAWEQVRDQTTTRKEAVLERAMPEPADTDPLLGHMAPAIREKLKNRILLALAAIYEPPDDRMPESYVLGHARGQEARERLRNQTIESGRGLASKLRVAAERFRVASFRLSDANERMRLASSQPSEFQAWVTRLDELNKDIQSADQRIGQLKNQIEGFKVEMGSKNKRLGEIREQLKDLGPLQRRIAIADRAKRAVEEFADQLRTPCAERLEESVTKIFRKIADKRFAKSEVRISVDSDPYLELADGNQLPLTGGSGFERRSFSIAFCLALAEITGQRIPLVIDTPVGNADSEYRERALRQLAEFDTDQIIILTHDEEVSKPFLDAIEDHVGQKILIEFDQATQASKVHHNKFFAFPR